MVAPMKRICLLWVAFLALLVALPGMVRGGSNPTNSLAWDRAQDRMTVDIQSLPLISFLQRFAAATGWHIFVEPDLTREISAKFSELPTGEGLARLLGDLNFALLPDEADPKTRHLYVFRTNRRQATKAVESPDKIPASAIPIPNELVVKLKPGSKINIDDLARSVGAKVIGRMDEQGAYLLKFDDAEATQSAKKELLANPDVQAVESNFNADPPPQLSSSSTSNAAEPKLNPATNTSNCQLVIGLIDTATQPMGDNLAPFFKKPIQVAGNYTPDPGNITHGTAMATAMMQMLQQKTGGTTSVRIQPVDVYGSSSTTTTFDVANGIIQAVNSGANVINLSLGSSGDSQFLHDTITAVAKRGIPIYAAAGNEPVTTPTYPAAYPEVVAVTASDPNGQIASYANRGSFIDLMAPGNDVVPYNGQSYFVQGTSTSTAFASGMAAGLADASHACADQAQSLLVKSLKPAAAKPGQ